MDSIFKKLNYKDHKKIFIWNAPESFEENIMSVVGQSEIKREVTSDDKIDFFVGFVTQQAQINDITERIAPKLVGDAVFWLCYPKKTSQKYTCDFNRDKGWDVLGKYDLESVRQIAIDENWSALRFRKIQYIANMHREESRALSAKGKERSPKKD